MSTDLLVEDLADLIDLDGVPPCETWLFPEFTERCGNPSVVRVTMHCPEHGRIGPEFLCAECLEEARAGGLDCDRCDSPLSDAREI